MHADVAVGRLRCGTESWCTPGFRETPWLQRETFRLRDGQEGDITVAYLIVVGNNATTSAINDYFGYSPDAIALGDKAHKAYTEGPQRNYFEAGTLLIDLVDARTQKVLARNHITRPVLRDPPLEVRKPRIEEAVNEALSRVRFKH